MSADCVLSALSSRQMAEQIRDASQRIIFVAPGIQGETARALAVRVDQLGRLALTVSLDFDEHTLRMGYGSLEGVETLRKAGIEPTHSPGLRCGILIVDDRGWIFTPTALYLEQEPQSIETPNAVPLSADQGSALAVRLSPAAKKEAIGQAATPEEARRIAQLPAELGVKPVDAMHFNAVKLAIDTAPPVKFDIARQVRVFEPYLQYVELSLIGAAVQPHRVRIPRALQNLGASIDLEGKLKTTFDLIERGSALSSKAIEDELNEIRKNFTPSLGKDHGRVVLKAAKPHLATRIAQLRAKLEAHQRKVEGELQTRLDESKKQVIDYYIPLATASPPDALLGNLLSPGTDEAAIRSWIEDEISKVFPVAKDLINKMTLEERYKDVTFETLNGEDFLESVQQAFPRVDWEKAYEEFKAAGETESATTLP